MKNTISALKKPTAWYYIVMIAFALLYSTIALSNHYFFRSYTEDYGFFNFVLYDFAHFRMSPVPTLFIYGAKANIFFNHFSITLMYLVPFYWLFNWLTGSYTLHLIQIGVIMLGGWAMYKIVILKTADKWLGVLTLLFYFLLQGQFTNFTVDFNGSVAAICFVPLFIYFFETERFRAATIILVLSLFSREDMPLSYVFICFVLMIWHWKEKKKIYRCVAYIAVCILYFVIVFNVFVPLSESVNTPHNYFDYTALGHSPLDAFIFILQNPFEAIRLLFVNHSGNPTYDGVKLEFYMVYFISGGYLLLYKPYYLIWFIPPICQKMFNDQPFRWSIEGYYSVMMPVLLPVSVFLVIPEIYKKGISKYLVGFTACILAASVTIYMFNPLHHIIPWVDTTKENIFAPAFFHPDYNTKKIHEDLKLIPPDAKVSASARILPHLAQRKNIYEFPDVEDAQYIALFTFHDFYAVPEKKYHDSLNYYLLSPNWNIIAESYPFLLLKKEPNHFKQSDFVLYDAKTRAYDSLFEYLTNPNLNLLASESPVFVFAREQNQNEYMDDFTCDAEKTSADGKNFIASNNTYIDIGGKCVTEKAHTGKHSLKLSGEEHYGMNYTITNIIHGGIVRINAWRYSQSGTGLITATINDSTIYYSPKPTVRDSCGWEELSLTTFVPAGCPELKLYMWNNGNTPVYFDDIDVKVCRYIPNKF